MSSSRPAAPLLAVVLAAGRGTRMGAETAKVLLPACGRPLAEWVLEACREAGAREQVLVIGHEAEAVRAHFASTPGCRFVLQAPQLGTGHAVAVTEPLFRDRPEAELLVLNGDAPLVTGPALAGLLETHRRQEATATLATCHLEDPTGYGRILRDAGGRFTGIAEEKDASPQERAQREVNAGYYAFRAGPLFEALARLDRGNRQGEYYLTDVPGLLLAGGHRVALHDRMAPEEIYGANTPEELERVESILSQRGPRAPR